MLHRILSGAALLVALASTIPVAAQTGEIIDRTELRICADPNNLPFSNEKEQGFENRIAHVIGEELKLPVSYVFFPQVIGFVRNTLRARRCDLMMGTIAGDDIVQTTNPYYHTTYVAVYLKEGGFTFTDFDDPRLKSMRLGVVSATPPSDLLVRHQLLDNLKSYALVVDTRYESPAHQMMEDVANGEIDLALVWGPIAGYYIKQESLPLAMKILRSEPGTARMDYRIAMGVRANEPEWRRRINAAITKRQAQIADILRDYGVPLVNDVGQLEGGR